MLRQTHGPAQTLSTDACEQEIRRRGHLEQDFASLLKAAAAAKSAWHHLPARGRTRQRLLSEADIGHRAHPQQTNRRTSTEPRIFWRRTARGICPSEIAAVMAGA